MSRADHIPALIKSNPTEVINPVSDLHGLLFLFLFAVHSVVDLKLTIPQCFFTNVEYITKTLMSTTAYHIKVEIIPTEVMHANVSDLPGLLLLVVLAVHNVVDLLTCP